MPEMFSHTSGFWMAQGFLFSSKLCHALCSNGPMAQAKATQVGPTCCPKETCPGGILPFKLCSYV